tara:strand:- start:42114 stop:42380 length:267 start_codon:yes stop_codon:yes gene_type:complete
MKTHTNSNNSATRADTSRAAGMPAFLTQKEAAELLRISQRTLERYRLDGIGPKFISARRRILYSLDELVDWTRANTFQSTSEANYRDC